MTHPGQLLKRERLYAGKEMGQNFLSDPSTARMIVHRTGIKPDSNVLEIGPGLGALTVHIAKLTGQVTVVEKDRRLLPLLEQELFENGIDGVHILNQDILKTDIAEIAAGNPLVIIGNLPYNISSQILFRLVLERSHIDRAFLMFQKELARRILSPPGTKAYSRLAAVAAYAARIRWVADVGPSCFFPRPEVDSTVLEFEFVHRPAVSSGLERLVFDVIKAAFSKRRKSLKNAMAGGEMGLTKPFVAQALSLADIAPERRAETLSVEEFIGLARAVAALKKGQT